MTVEKFTRHAPDWAPLRLDASRLKIANWVNRQGNFCHGTVNRIDDRPEGIIREILKDGSIFEYQTQAGAHYHGFSRLIYASGCYAMAYFCNNTPHGEKVVHRPDDSVRVHVIMRDGRT